jgi:sterol desaturase/sphingolipid hydroxylase (fatty acid hydroxylase superfamily)
MFPGLPSPMNHNTHHKKYNKNYGFGIFDRFHNTQDNK